MIGLDEDEIDALAQAGAVVLRWVVLVLGVGFLARVACGCGGSEFTVSVFPDAGRELVDAGGDLVVMIDATSPETETSTPHQVRTSERDATPPAPAADAERPDAIAPELDAGDREDATPAHEAGPPPACAPSSCPVCAIAQGYACCTAAGACGCENPSQGGSCL